MPSASPGAAQSPEMGRHTHQPASEMDLLWEDPTGACSPFSCAPLRGPDLACSPSLRPGWGRGPQQAAAGDHSPAARQPWSGLVSSQAPPTLPLPVDLSSWLWVWPCPCTPGGHQTSLGTHEAQPRASGVCHRLGPPGPGRTGCPRRNLKAQRRGVPSLGWPQEAVGPRV